MNLTRVGLVGLSVLVLILIGFGVILSTRSAGERLANDASEDVPFDDHVQAVVSSHELATEAGLEILDAGGSAADAAIAVAAVLSVVEPWFSSVLGGGTWALYYDSSNDTITSLDGVGPTGSKVTVADYSRRAGNSGIHQANVPGAWDGWMIWLENYGKLDLGDILEPAIRIAKEGYPVSGEMSEWLERQAEETMARPDTARIYAPEGILLKEGETVYQTDLALTFEELVFVYDENKSSGRLEAIQAVRDYYYRGPIANRLVDYSNRNDGYLTLDDFNGFSAKIVEPISIDYNDEITVYQNPPNSQGITMLLALNILKDYDFSRMDPDSADAIHVQAEAIKLAFADRYYHVGDPDRVDVPVAELLSDRHANRQRARIDMERAMEWPIQDGFESLPDDIAHTTTFHVVDKEGNGAAVTTSLGAHFFVIEDTGIHINHRMRFLALDEGNPNQVSPGYKVRHTSNPYMATRNGDLFMLGGNTGADTQSQGQAQQFVSVVEFNMTALEAVTRPRFISTAFPSTVYSYQVRNTLQVEQGFPSDVLEDLRNRGHNLSIGQGTWGSANMIIVKDGGQDADIGAEPRTGISYGEKK
jgi:gamma-glutamyltranspeptidase / glutathione hydrolase